MSFTRTIFADKDGMYSQLMVDRDHALTNASLEDLPRYKRQYWKGLAHGLEKAARLIQNWQGEQMPEPASETTVQTRFVPQQGITLDGVWMPLQLLEELSEQGTYDSMLGPGNAFISLNRDQERVLIARDLAVKETRGGCHRGPALSAFMDTLVYPAPPIAKDKGDNHG